MKILESPEVKAEKQALDGSNILYGIIYGHMCTKTGLWYVGLTTTSVVHRSQLDGSNYLKTRDGNYIHTKFGPAIKEYGWDNFEHHILGYYSLEKLSDMEIYWIAEKDSYNRGYNSTSGGIGTWPEHLSECARAKIAESNRHRKVSDETKRKIAESKKGKRFLSDEHYKKLAKTLKEKNKGAGNPMYGLKHSEESKQQLSERFSGEKNPNYGKRGLKSPIRKDVVQLDTDLNYIQTFISASEAGKYLGLYNGSQISACCKGKQKTCGGYIWKYLSDYNKNS